MKSVNNRFREYNLSLPASIAQEIKGIAAEHKLTEIEVLRKFIMLGFVAASIERNPNEQLLIHSGEETKELVVFGKVAAPVAA